MDYKEFSSKIKAKYPAYQDMDDKELAEKMVAKYPQYSDVTFDEVSSETAPPETAPATVSTTAPKQPGVFSKITGAMDQAETNLGEGAYKDVQLVKEAATRPNTNLPTRIAETTGNVLGGVARTGINMLNVPLAGAGTLAQQAFPYTTSKLGEALTAKRQLTPWSQGEGTSVADVLGMVGARIRRLEQENPRAAQQLKNVLAVGQILPYAKIAQVAGKPIIAGTAEALEAGATKTGELAKAGTAKAGELVEAAGKKGEGVLLGSIPKSQLKKYAGSPSESATEGLKKVVNDISEFGLDSPMGLRKSQEKAVARLATENENYERTLQKFSSVPQQAIDAINVNSIIDGVKAEIASRGPLVDQIGIGLPEDITKAIRILDGLKEDLAGRKMSGLMFPHQLPKVKQVISRDTKAFAKGAIPTPDDVLKHNVGKVTYLRVMDKLNNKLATAGYPEFKQMGQNIKTLNNLKTILDDAALSGNKITPADVQNILLKITLGGGAGYATGVGTGGVIGGILLSTMAEKAVKATPSLAMKLGRVMQGKKTLAEIVPELTPAEADALKYNVSNAFKGRTITALHKYNPGEPYPEQSYIGIMGTTPKKVIYQHPKD